MWREECRWFLDLREWSELDTALGEDAFLVGVFDFAHLGDGVGEFDESGVGVAAGENDVGHLGLAAEDVGDGLGREHLVADGVVDLVEDDEVPVAGEDGVGGFGPGGFDHADVFGIGLGAADFDEAAAHLFDDEAAVGGFVEDFGGVELAVVPGAFEELQDQDAHAVAGGAEGSSEGGGGLALAGAGVDQDQSAS